jgi:hypothetical protein
METRAFNAESLHDPANNFSNRKSQGVEGHLPLLRLTQKAGIFGAQTFSVSGVEIERERNVASAQSHVP